jgi:hypothetical protein
MIERGYVVYRLADGVIMERGTAMGDAAYSLPVSAGYALLVDGVPVQFVGSEFFVLDGTIEAINPPNVTSVSPNSGSIAGGTPITISGSNFLGTTSVTIGGVAATSVVVVNNTTITCITGANLAGVTNLIVGKVNSAAILINGFTYV